MKIQKARQRTQTFQIKKEREPSKDKRKKETEKKDGALLKSLFSKRRISKKTEKGHRI